eukprot:6670338-Prymnesium_polylepis.1
MPGGRHIVTTRTPDALYLFDPLFALRPPRACGLLVVDCVFHDIEVSHAPRQGTLASDMERLS